MFWVGSETDGKGFAVPYEKIAIHAVSRGSEASDGNEGEPACVYVQLMGSDAVDENGAVLERPAAGHGNGNGNAETAEDNEEDDDDEESDPRYDEDEEEMYELKLVPENSASRGSSNFMPTASARRLPFLSNSRLDLPLALYLYGSPPRRVIGHGIAIPDHGRRRRRSFCQRCHGTTVCCRHPDWTGRRTELGRIVGAGMGYGG